MLAGSTMHGSALIRDYVRSVSEKKEATAIGADAFATSAAQAALINAGSGHAMDYDDTQLSTTPDRTFGLLTHPTVPVLAAALAVAERRGASGAAFLEAFLVGFEVECKIAEAIDPNHYERGFHSRARPAPLARRRPRQAAELERAGDRPHAGHRGQHVERHPREFRIDDQAAACGAGRANGVVAAELAARGFTGGDNGLDGQWGYFQVFGGGADLDRLIPVMGKPYAIVSPGVSIKPYPCGSLSHPTLDAMLKAVIDHDLKPDQIKRCACARATTSWSRSGTRSRRTSWRRSSPSRS
jgi:2-methylcitrate dehydratase PrpD